MPVDASIPLQGIQPSPFKTLSDILGVKQQQQNLQTGLATQQSAQAGAVQDTIKAQEARRVSALLQDPIGNGILDKDGQPTKEAMPKILSVAPTTGATRAAEIFTGAKDKVAFDSSIGQLNEDQRAALGADLSAAGSSGMTAEQTKDLITNHVEQNPKLARAAMSMMRTMPADPQGLRQWQVGMGRTVMGPTGAAGLNSVSTSPINTGAKTNLVQTTPSGSVGSAGNLTNTLTPEGAKPVLATNSSGQLIGINPANPNQAGVVGSGNAPTLGGGGRPGAPAAPPSVNDVNPTHARSTVLNAGAEGISARVGQAVNAANQSPQSIDALERARSILDKSGGPNTAFGFDSKTALKNMLAGLGVDTHGADDANSLIKNLARYEATRATSAGLGHTDSARELAHAGSPNTDLDKEALKGIVTQSLATEMAMRDYAKAQAANTDPQTMIRNEADFRNIPHLIQAYEYGLSRNADEANAFLKKHGISASEMKKSREAIKEFGGR